MNATYSYVAFFDKAEGAWSDYVDAQKKTDYDAEAKQRPARNRYKSILG